MEKHLDRADILEDNMTNIYYLLLGQCNEALQHGLSVHGYFEYKYISFDAKCLLKQIKVKIKGIKQERHLNTYDSVYKLIRKFSIFIKPRMNHAKNFRSAS